MSRHGPKSSKVASPTRHKKLRRWPSPSDTSGGDVDVDVPDDDALAALIAQLAARVYPSFLLPPDRSFPPDWTGRVGFQVTSAIFRDRVC